MHISPYHKKRSVQHFLLGVFTGTIIAYLIFTYMYGKMYEDVLLDKIQLQTKVSEVERQNEVLLLAKEDLQEKAILTIDAIEITFLNTDELKLDRLITHQFEDLIKQELTDIIGKDSQSVALNDEMLIMLIENKKYIIDDLTYEFKVRKLTISNKIKLTLFINLTK